MFSTQNSCPRLQTTLKTDHQGGYEFEKTRIYLSGRTLEIIIPAKLPAYWLGIEISVKDGKFEAFPAGVPMQGGEVKFEVLEQKLTLESQRFRSGEVLSGELELRFSQIAQGGEKSDYHISGCFSAVIRPEGFDPLIPENIRTLGAADMEIALYEYGQPLHEQSFAPNQAGLTRTMLLRQTMKDPTKDIRELTWDITPGAELTDGGDERLTVWYSELGGRWRSIFYKVWNSVSDPMPLEID